MPNWVFNHMRVAREHIHSIFRTDINNKGTVENVVVDFGQAVPMPPSLDIDSSSLNEQRVYYFLSEKLTLGKEEVVRKIEELGIKDNPFFDNKLSDNWFVEIANRTGNRTRALSEQEREEFFVCGQRILLNIINYGVPTWYEWHRKYWGCKWNACNSEIIKDESDEKEIVVCFETPWCPPIAWCQALAKMGIDFHLVWEEEQGFHGEIYGHDGEYGEKWTAFQRKKGDE